MTASLRRILTTPWHWLMNRIERASVSTEQKHRLLHYTIFIVLGLPTLVGFGIYSLLAGNQFIGVLVGVSTAGLIGGWFALLRVRNGQVVHRINAAIYSFLLLHMLVLGGEEGSKILWMYTFPLFTFFLLGTREGLVWNLGCLAALGGLIEDPFGWFSVYPYGIHFKIRFVATYALVSMISFWFQYLRHDYFVRMEERQAELEREHDRLVREAAERRKAEEQKGRLIVELRTALDQVKTLSGLIPVCANCHKIRDDEGFWDRMESYISRHSDARFSHGICPDCIDKLYPEYKRAANGD